MKRLLASFFRWVAPVVLLVVTACNSGVDKAKFDPAYKAGKALQVEVASTGGTGPAAEVKQKAFATEVAALNGRTTNELEQRALTAYADANDAYNGFIRFRHLDLEAEGGRIPLMGTNIDLANRFKLPIQTTNGVQWVQSSEALKVLHAAAEKRLEDANSIINGGA